MNIKSLKNSSYIKYKTTSTAKDVVTGQNFLVLKQLTKHKSDGLHSRGLNTQRIITSKIVGLNFGGLFSRMTHHWNFP